MAKYIVDVIMSTGVEIEVEARNEEEARDIALEEAESLMADDWDCEVDCVYRDDDDDDEDEVDEDA